MFTYAHAQVNYTGELDNAGTSLYGTTQKDILFTTIGTMINGVLGLAGVILLVMVIYGGFLWMTAGGKAEQLEKSKSVLINSIIGLVIILSSFAISQFVIKSIQSPSLTSTSGSSKTGK